MSYLDTVFEDDRELDDDEEITELDDLEEPPPLEDDEIAHIGILRKSGRYPWGSGANPHQRYKMFLDHVEDLKRQGLTETEIAKGFGMYTDDDGITTTELRAAKTIARNGKRAADVSMAERLKAKGLSNVAIGERMGINESSVRALLDPGLKERQDILMNIANTLKQDLNENGGYLDVGTGTEAHIGLQLGITGISKEKLNVALAILKEEGYRVDQIKTPQLGTGKYTTVKVLSPPGTKYADLHRNSDQIRVIGKFTEDGGRSFFGLVEPLSVNSKRVDVRYAEDGGADMDGVIQLRRGVDDISLGNSKYAQVRIAVDGTHYLKGMAMYADDLPDGVDIRFNTNKAKADIGNDKLAAMKKMKRDPNDKSQIDPDNPFGSVVRQKTEVGKDGKERAVSALNIVSEEGKWNEWSRNFSSQFLSKQPKGLAEEQLGLAYDIRKQEYDEITALTNPAVKRKLLESFADGADSAAVHLKAAGLPRTRNHVILPIPSLKEGEIYAPNYNDGERVVLVRHPHGGKFEIPELTVNNKNREAKRVMGNAADAVGIHPKVAGRLSGADFDGDTVLVIPNNKGRVKNEGSLEGLKDFDPQAAYKPYEGMRTIDGGTWNAAERKVVFPEGKSSSGRAKQQQMGDVSNLITDMTIKGASNAEIARAVRHSMVVIDAEKHSLNYKQSAIDNGIKELKTKYQNSSRGGASTLISRAKSEARIPEQTLRKAAQGGPIDKATGKKVFVPTNATFVDKDGNVQPRMTKTSKMAVVDNAHKLSSGTPMEAVYADHANRLKSLANNARKEYISTKPIPYSPSAKKTYANEVFILKAKLNLAQMNAPLERKAQLLAKTVVKMKTQSNPDMDPADLKKIKSQALTEARIRVGSKKEAVKITPLEWEAIQHGAISNNMLESILDHADLDQVKALATPREATVMVPAKLLRAKNMLAAGYSQAEVAGALGIPASTLNSALASEKGASEWS
jgi:hypothetical protein